MERTGASTCSKAKIRTVGDVQRVKCQATALLGACLLRAMADRFLFVGSLL